MKVYYDGTTGYLELHADRAPLGPYAGEYSEENDPCGDCYNSAVEQAIVDFEEQHDVTLYILGRSGRHVCIEDTARNRRRWLALSRAAKKAARDLWRMMREPSREGFGLAVEAIDDSHLGPND